MRYVVQRAAIASSLVALIGATALWGGSAELEMAHKYYNSTNFEASLKVLNAIPDKDAAVYELCGLNHYMQGDYKRAIESLEVSLKYEPGNSMTTLWLARSYGRRAETSSPFTAMGYASHARQNFERAAQLDEHNLEALSDLFEYYLDAPGFLGGGMERAQAQVGRIARVDAAEAQWAEAKIAEKHKQYRAVEEHLRQAVTLAPRRIGLRLELARFLARQGRFAQAEASFAEAEEIAPGSPRVLYAKAETYVKTSRNLDSAKQMLNRYMKLALTPDDPSRADAAKLLRQAQGS
jgi:tetratricopeptide (TPR) repeat protein